MFSKQKFTNGAIMKEVQGKEFEIGGIMQLHLEDIRGRITICE